jgi:hypothetical protein
MSLPRAMRAPAQIVAEARALPGARGRHPTWKRWRDKLPVADGLELAQEELSRATFLGMAGYGSLRKDDGG